MGTEAPTWEEVGPLWPNRETSRFMSAGGLRWHVQTGGQGPVVLLLHGTGSASFSWGDVLPLLMPACTVVAPDLPGHGLTTGAGREALSLTGMARAVAALVAALGVTPVLAAGHSAGAAVLLRLAIDRRVVPRQVVGLNAAIIPPPSAYRALVAPFAHRLATTRLAAAATASLAARTPVVEALLRSTGSRIPGQRRALYRRFFRSEGHCRDVLAMMADWALAELMPDLPRVPCPVTLVCGRQDTWVPLHALRRHAAAIPGHAVVEVDGGHLFHEEHPREAAEIILAQLDRLPQAGAIGAL